MAVDAYAYGWQSAGSTTYGGGTGPAASPGYGSYSAYGFKKRSYRSNPKRPSNPRGWGASKVFDPFGTPWGGVPKSPAAAGVAKAFSRILRRGNWERPLTAWGERGVDKITRDAFEKAFAGWLVTQATPAADWYSPFGIEFGPQVPTDPFQWMMNRSMRRPKWFGRRKKRRNRRRRY